MYIVIVHTIWANRDHWAIVLLFVFYALLLRSTSGTNEWEKKQNKCRVYKNFLIFFLSLSFQLFFGFFSPQSLLRPSPFISFSYYQDECLIGFGSFLTSKSQYIHVLYCVNKSVHWHSHNLFIDFHYNEISVCSISVYIVFVDSNREQSNYDNNKKSRCGGFDESQLQFNKKKTIKLLCTMLQRI